MGNGFGGGIFSVSYKNQRLSTALGGGFNRYVGDHWGQVLWVKNYIGMLDPEHEYYRNKGTKNDGNLYVKADYAWTDKLNAYVDMQYRYITYQIKGTNDKWNSLTNEGLSIWILMKRLAFSIRRLGFPGR
jgi:iron complex outermembrane receptor protein